jgi:hypothetical protein
LPIGIDTLPPKSRLHFKNTSTSFRDFECWRRCRFGMERGHALLNSSWRWRVKTLFFGVSARSLLMI